MSVLREVRLEAGGAGMFGQDGESVREEETEPSDGTRQSDSGERS